MQSIQFGGSSYKGLWAAARAWAVAMLPNTDNVGVDEDPGAAAAHLEGFCWTEAQKSDEGAPKGVNPDEWRAACRMALVERIEQSRKDLPVSWVTSCAKLGRVTLLVRAQDALAKCKTWGGRPEVLHEAFPWELRGVVGQIMEEVRRHRGTPGADAALEALAAFWLVT